MNPRSLRANESRFARSCCCHLPAFRSLQPLQAGDRFLLYTDGLVDATNAAGEFFELERVKTAVAAGAGLAAEAVADLILAKTRGWTAAASDDVTLVLVDCL